MTSCWRCGGTVIPCWGESRCLQCGASVDRPRAAGDRDARGPIIPRRKMRQAICPDCGRLLTTVGMGRHRKAHEVGA